MYNAKLEVPPAITWAMIIAIFTLILLILTDQTYAQSNNLSADVSLVELDITSTPIIQSSFVFESDSYTNEEQSGEQTTMTASAGKVVVTTTAEPKFIDVKAQKTLFDFARVIPVKTPKTYLILGSPGKYSVEVITSEPEAGIQRQNFVLVIPGSTVDPDLPPVEPDKPSPGVGDFSELAKLAHQLAVQMKDDITYAALKQELATAVRDLTTTDLTFEQAIDIVQTAVISAMKSRRGSSLQKDWEKGWRIPINTWFAESKVETKNEYVAAWIAVVDEMIQHVLKPQISTLPTTSIQSAQPVYFQSFNQYCPNGQCPTPNTFRRRR